MDVLLLYVVKAFRPLMYLAINFMSIGGICVSRSFFVRVCMFTVLNALLMSSATAMVRAGGILWLKPDAIVLLML